MNGPRLPVAALTIWAVAPHIEVLISNDYLTKVQRILWNKTFMVN